MLKRISGKYRIDNNFIVINGERIALTDSADIKRNPLLVTALSNGLLIYGGARTIGFGVIIGVFTNTTAFLLTIPLTAMLYAVIKWPNFSKKNKNDGTYIIEFTTLKPNIVALHKLLTIL